MTFDLDIPWVEKYRPKSFDDIVSQSIAINNLKEFVRSGDMPHMIFTGPAGTGKTSTALIIARHILKDEDYTSNVLELNASSEVRMDYVRRVLKRFVEQNLNINDSLKLVILDEADNIPSQVQQALRRIIERTSNNVRFILMCNYINRIIDPIISRCAVFRFVSLPKEKIVERLKFIVEQEKLTIPKKAEDQFFDTLFFISGGDLRKAINTLQMSVALDLLENLNINEILKISGFVEESKLKKLIEALNEKDFAAAKEVLDSIITFDSRNFLRQISNVLPEFNLKPKSKNTVYSFLGDIDYRISQGADEKIQIHALISEILSKISE